MSGRDEFERYMCEGECVEEFGLWAFGCGYEARGMRENAMEWNRLHGGEYEIVMSNHPREDMRSMVELWRKSKQKLCLNLGCC